MLWQLAAAGAMSVMKGNAARMQDKVGSVLGEAEAQSANIIREGKNMERAAKGSLSRFMQSENNRRILNAAGMRFNSAQEELMRTQDFGIEASIERQLAAAEVSGALAANSAFAGAAGGAVDVLMQTTRLKNARAEQMQMKKQRTITYEQVKQMTGIIPQAVASMGEVQFDDGIDKSVNWNQYVDKYNRGWVGDFIVGAGSAWLAAGAPGAGDLTGQAAASATYGTTLGSQQTAMLAEQDAAFGIGVNASRAFKELLL